MDIKTVLAERGSTHGDFTDNADVAQRLKEVVESSKNWPECTSVERESIHMILHKISRICSGNPHLKQHWEDIAGYAQLVEERLTEW